MVSSHGLSWVSWYVQNIHPFDVFCPLISPCIKSSRQLFKAVIQFPIPQCFRIFSTSTGSLALLGKLGYSPYNAYRNEPPYS